MTHKSALAILGFVAVAAASGCSTTGTPSTAATLVNWGKTYRPRCENADGTVVDGEWRAVCWAYLTSIDGHKATGFLASENRVPLGTHTLSIRCSYVIADARDNRVPPTHSTLNYEESFDSPIKYYIWAEVTGDQCTVRVSDKAPDPPAPLSKSLL
jgi:hypothetical protein